MATQTNLNVAQSAKARSTEIPLPKWNNFASVTTYLTSFVGVVVGLLAAIHPGFNEPQSVQAVVTAVALVIATGAQTKCCLAS